MAIQQVSRGVQDKGGKYFGVKEENAEAHLHKEWYIGGGEDKI